MSATGASSLRRSAPESRRSVLPGIGEGSGRNSAQLTISRPMQAIESIPLTAAAQAEARRVRIITGAYSGITEHAWMWGERPGAHTVKRTGKKYHNGWSRTDAVHTVTLTPAGVRGLQAIPEEIRALSADERMPLIHAEAAGARCAKVVWATDGKPLRTASGWLAWEWYGERPVTYHGSTEAGARAGLARKVQLLAEAAALSERTRNGIPPLYRETVTVADVRQFTGWCAPGCREWVQAHLGANKTRAPWGEVAQAALRDGSSYGLRLRELLGVTPDGPYTFA